jgi:hypothetical protein
LSTRNIYQSQNPTKGRVVKTINTSELANEDFNKFINDLTEQRNNVPAQKSIEDEKKEDFLKSQ